MEPYLKPEGSKMHTLNEFQKKILIVDDDLDLLSAIEVILSAAGYSVITAPSSEEACSQIDIHAPDIVLSDINMPDGDGFDLKKILKEASTPVVFVSMSGAMSKESCAEQGIHYHLAKPFSEVELSDVLARAATAN